MDRFALPLRIARADLLNKNHPNELAMNCQL